MTRAGRASATLSGVPSLFRRKSADLAAPGAEVPASATDPADADQARGHTPSKRERGIATPKRVSVRRTPEPPPANRREAYRREREAMADRRAGAAKGDPRYLNKRDQGPERALVRDVVDARLTAGPWFFLVTMLQWLAMIVRLPVTAQVGLQTLWLGLAMLTVLDSAIISRRIKKIVRERHPETTERMFSLGYYGVTRAIMARKMRMPRPRIKLGASF